jgi:hypothetical protein
MLIYVNQLKIQGTDDFVSVIGAIAGWLKKSTGRHFSVRDLTSGEDFTIGRQFVRTHKADNQEPRLYSVLFSNPDNRIRGRDWVTEIGVRVNDSNIDFTIQLETKDVSTQVRDIPITTKPKVIEFVNENVSLAPATVGLDVKKLKADGEYELKAFLHEIERSERDYPLVLMSKLKVGQYSTNPWTLQKHLIGLAQVVICEELDSWLMTSILGKEYSTWDGAVNIIYPRRMYTYCRNKLLRSEKIEEFNNNRRQPSLEVLSIITHYSNAYKSRQHFSPHDVKAKKIADQRSLLKQRIAEGEDSDYESLFLEAMEQIDGHDEVISNLQDEHRKQLDQIENMCLSTEEEKDDLQNENYRLQSKLDSLKAIKGNKQASIDNKTLFEAIAFPTPENLLVVLEQLFSDRVVVLDSAYKTAKQSTKFSQSPKLANMLHRLVTTYYNGISRVSDTEAKRVFTDSEYAAKESQTVRHSPELSSKRTFEYNGQMVQMFRHLKIGVADNVEQTIRVHFHWDADNQKIVIGYCGPHLPLS